MLQPVSGKVIPREEIPDDSFSAGVLGDGVGIVPDGDTVYAPFDSKVSHIASSRHAIGLDGSGLELLIHIGIDTVDMSGDGFTCFVNEGDSVRTGQPLIAFDREKIKNAGHSDIVAVLLTNSDDLENMVCGTR